MINGKELRIYYQAVKGMLDAMRKIIGCLLKQYFTDIEQAYPGEVYQRDLGIGKIFIEGGADGLKVLPGKRCSNVLLSAEEMIALYIDRWSIEVTFEEVHEHLGVGTQRQWSEKAIHRTTPILMGLYSLVCLMANELSKFQGIDVENTAWYQKETATFADYSKLPVRSFGGLIYFPGRLFLVLPEKMMD